MLIGLAVGLLLAVPLERLYQSELVEDLRSAVAATDAAAGNSLSGALNHRMVLLNGLRAFVEVTFDRPAFEADVLAYSSRLHGSISGIRSVQWVKEGVIQQAHPPRRQRERGRVQSPHRPPRVHP